MKYLGDSRNYKSRRWRNVIVGFGPRAIVDQAYLKICQIHSGFDLKLALKQVYAIYVRTVWDGHSF